MIRFRCPNCDVRLSAPTGSEGISTHCSYCAWPVQVPQGEGLLQPEREIPTAERQPPHERPAAPASSQCPRAAPSPASAGGLTTHLGLVFLPRSQRAVNGCRSCGGSWEPEGHTHSERCPYCSSRAVIVAPGASSIGWGLIGAVFLLLVGGSTWGIGKAAGFWGQGEDRPAQFPMTAVPFIEGGFAEDQRAFAQIRVHQIESALLGYQFRHGEYPAGLWELTVPPDGGAPLLAGDELFDPWGCEFLYQYPPIHPVNMETDLPDVYSAGPDNIPGTADDIGNW